MAKRGYIPIDKTDLPNYFEIDLAGQPFFMGANYNKMEKLFTIDLYDMKKVPIVLGERMVLNEMLWADIIDERLPSVDLVPMDESGKTKELTFDNFMETVFLFEDSLAEESEVPSLKNEVVEL